MIALVLVVLNLGFYYKRVKIGRQWIKILDFHCGLKNADSTWRSDWVSHSVGYLIGVTNSLW